MTILQIVSLTAGLILLTYVLLSYESEEKRLVTWLERTLAALSARNITFADRSLRIVQPLANGLDKLLTSVYGDRIWSEAALLTSTSLCVLFSGIAFKLSNPSARYVAIVALFVTCLFAQRMKLLRPTLYVLALLSLFAPTMDLGDDINLIGEGEAYSAIEDEVAEGARSVAMEDRFRDVLTLTLVAIAVDFLAVAASRITIRRACTSPTIFGSLAFLLFGTVAAPFLALLSGGISLVAMSLTISDFDYPSIVEMVITFYDQVLPYVALLNAAALLCSLVLAASIMLLLMCKIAMLLAPRALNAIIKLKFFENRKSLLGTSVMLIGLAHPNIVPIMEKVVKIAAG